MKFTGKKNNTIKNLITDFLHIIELVGVPIEGLTDRRKEKIAVSVLSCAHVKQSLREAKSIDEGYMLGTKAIIDFQNEHFAENRSRGSYDYVKRDDLDLLITADIVINSATLQQQSTNNPMRGYGLSADFVRLLHSYKTLQWEEELSQYLINHPSLSAELNQKRELERIPVILPSGVEYKLSAGGHNELQKTIVEEFLPVFGMGAEVLYLGDTDNRFLHRDDKALKALNFFTLEHEELPDIVAYSKDKNIVFLIEAYHSRGAMSLMRIRKLKEQLKDCTAHIVFITAFETRDAFWQFGKEVAWETEVWIAENPDHMIHMNGYKFLEIFK